MNRIYRPIRTLCLCAASLCCLAACSDFLDENAYGQLPAEDFFQSKEDLDASLNALYSVVAVSQSQNNYCGTNFLAGDDISTHPSSNKQPLREHDQYAVTDNNAWLTALWEQRYKVIKAANFIINNAGRTPVADPALVTRAIAQAHYWRAYSYFYLVTTWGEVPVVLEDELDPATPLSSVADVYELILSDLKIAEQGCPALYTEAPYLQNGVNYAVSEGAVKATMAYVYMCMAGWPLNLGADYYRLAADKAEEVIDAADRGTYYYRLLDDYADVYSMKYNYNNPELLLGIYYNRDRTASSTPQADVLQDMVQNGWGDTNGEIKFWKEFPEGTRKDATYNPQILENNGRNGETNLLDWWDESFTEQHPMFCIFTVGEGDTDYDYTKPSNTTLMTNGHRHRMIRYSEVLLWYAESQARADGTPNAQAYECLNQVRERAGEEPVSGLSTDAFINLAVQEHGWEVAGYWVAMVTRRDDQLRLNLLEQAFNERKANTPIEVAPGITRQETILIDASQTWNGESSIYLPYPSTDAEINPNLTR